VWRLAVKRFNGINPSSMISPKKSVLGLLLIVFVALTTGCTTPKRDTSIPWSRPADWEGQIPGMSGGMGR
jgi:CDP-diglyceride synthetase